VVRSGLEESVHLGHVAVCDARGRVLASAGDPAHLVFMHSSTKPVQAAVSLAAMGGERLSDRQVAVMCGSHVGEPPHVRAVISLLRRAGLSTDDLRTPPALPEDPAASVRVPRPVFHNCSGKHAGMLLACVRSGWDTRTYPRRSHPLQRRVLSAVRSISGVSPAVVGVDGCGVPVHAMRLRDVATVYARLAVPARLGELAPHVAHALAAMRSEPHMVAGAGALDTMLMQATAHIVSKEGAEALACAVDLRSGLGVAIKVADGGYRASGPALIRTLESIGALDTKERVALQAVAAPAVLGGGRAVGRLVCDLELVGPAASASME
jgi:L-asparaginase II